MIQQGWSYKELGTGFIIRMITREVIEGLLYITNNREILTECLTAFHVLNKTDRNWAPVQHTEFHFLDSLKYCSFLEIIDKQVHVYLIGERAKGRTYNILNIEGNSCSLLILSKNELIKHIKEESKKVDKLYLPEGFGQRIVYIKPDYVNNIYEPFIFNRQEMDNKMFKKSKWNFGVDIYSMNQPEYETKAEDILKEVIKEFD